MRRDVFYLMMVAALVAVFTLAGCGGGGGDAASSPNKTSAGLIAGMGWFFDNAAPDYSNNAFTCSLNVRLYYDESIAVDDIDSFTVSSPTGWQWTIFPANGQSGTTSTGKPFISTSIYYGENPNGFPLAGTWTAAITLKNGTTSSLQQTLHEQGSAADATHQFLYTEEDWTPTANPSLYIAALKRFPTQGYTVQFNASNGGSITSTGLPAVRASFLATEPRAYNMYCWLFDANNVYLGSTIPTYSTLDHFSTNLISDNGELSITPASAPSANTEITDLSTVKYIRIVILDGAQFAPTSYSSVDYRSFTSLIPVN